MMAEGIKILIVSPSFEQIGGQSVQAEKLFSELARVEGITVGHQPIDPKFLSALQKIKYVRTVVTSLKYLYDLLRRVPAYDIVHVFSASYYSFILATIPAIYIGKFYGKKVLLNYHSGEAEDHLENWKGSALPAIKKADAITVPSGYLVDVFEKFGFMARSIFNFVDVEKLRFRQRSPVRPIFLSNRNFEELYNVGCTLRAFQLIQKEYPDSQLVVAGGGSRETELKDLAKALDLKNTEFVGQVSRERMAELYDQAEIYLNSSNIDNMPVSIIEAFASGLPVVSTNAGGIPYVVEDGVNGLLAGLNDHTALADAALKLLRDNELAQKIITNARRDCVKYSWDNVKAEWLQTYRSLIDG
jgi:glycosyltransferase involved in cell wall biosynthesis